VIAFLDNTLPQRAPDPAPYPGPYQECTLVR
jgi:hypothetical protein